MLLAKQVSRPDTQLTYSRVGWRRLLGPGVAGSESKKKENK